MKSFSLKDGLFIIIMKINIYVSISFICVLYLKSPHAQAHFKDYKDALEASSRIKSNQLYSSSSPSASVSTSQNLSKKLNIPAVSATMSMNINSASASASSSQFDYRYHLKFTTYHSFPLFPDHLLLFV